MAANTLETYPTHEAARMRLAKLELPEPVVAVVEQPDGTLAGGSLVESARALVKAGLAEDAVSVLAQSLSRRGAAWSRITRWLWEKCDERVRAVTAAGRRHSRDR